MGALKTTAGLATGKRDTYYPESDGKPMAETDLHWLETVELTLMLQLRYVAMADVYVASDLLLYYEAGNPGAAVAPDVFVVFGVANHQRRTYKLWEEGVAPAVVFEVTSRKTRVEDSRSKKSLYARLGVAEYYLYDPDAEYLGPPLQGFRWVDGAYEPMTPDEDGALRSAALGLVLRLIDGRLQLFDAATGERLLRTKERDAALARSEAEVARLRAEVARLRGEGT